ncbi:ATP12 family chaperone protein [Falsirhodobacter deserti]|uniref:ATP12 family chaperone protein n=1 Tax=Falsirhodobacter deserti TaxID=1365611 RepID=UPI000FE3BE7E|nr:ATP12 family protein [Falsirhodobacter deserti]
MSWAPKRFWTAATVHAEEGGHSVRLDGRPVRTPAKAPLLLPTEGLARLIAEEWDAQQGEVRPDTMPATRTANSAIDKVATQFDGVVCELARYGGSDLLCYRADGPAELVDRQRAWDPVLAWAAERLEAPLTVTEGIVPVDQPAPSLMRLRGQLQAMSAFQLAALYDLVAISGSLVLGLAVAHGRLTGAEAFALSRIDEAFQSETWGLDDEAVAAEEVRLAAFLAAERFFLLCR